MELPLLGGAALRAGGGADWPAAFNLSRPAAAVRLEARSDWDPLLGACHRGGLAGQGRAAWPSFSPLKQAAPKVALPP